MAKTLVTGATGFIGSHLVRALLAQGDEVTCLVRPTSRSEGLASLGTRLAPGDILDEATIAAALEGIDVVYHLAGVTKAFRNRHFFRINEGGVENVARACAGRTSPPVLVVVSSLSAAGPSSAERLRCESDPPQPVSYYGRSKRAGEVAAERLAAEVPISIVRPPIVLGEGDTNGAALYRSIARWGVHLVPGRTGWRVSIIHSEDLAAALLLVAERGERIAPPSSDANEAAGYYFVADERHPTYVELGQLIGNVLERRVRIVRPSLAMAWLAAAGSELGALAMRQPSIFNFDKVREAVAGSWTCSDERIRQTLGFATAKPLIERLRQIGEWYRREGWI